MGNRLHITCPELLAAAVTDVRIADPIIHRSAIQHTSRAAGGAFTRGLVDAVLFQRRNMKSLVRRSIGVAVAVLLCTTSAVADPITLVTTRFVSVALRTPEGGGVFNHVENADALDVSLKIGPLPFVTARLRTDASNSAHIVASGTAKAEPTDRHAGDAQVEYRFFVGIETLQPFDVLLEATGTGDPMQAGVTFFIRDFFGDGDLFERLTIPGSGRMTLHGVLRPDHPDDEGRTWYPFALLGSAYADPGGAPASVRFNMSVSFPPDSAPVPEPGTILLVATGLCGVLNRGRRSGCARYRDTNPTGNLGTRSPLRAAESA